MLRWGLRSASVLMLGFSFNCHVFFYYNFLYFLLHQNRGFDLIPFSETTGYNAVQMGEPSQIRQPKTTLESSTEHWPASSTHSETHCLAFSTSLQGILAQTCLLPQPSLVLKTVPVWPFCCRALSASLLIEHRYSFGSHVWISHMLPDPDASVPGSLPLLCPPPQATHFLN